MAPDLYRLWQDRAAGISCDPAGLANFRCNYLRFQREIDLARF